MQPVDTELNRAEDELLQEETSLHTEFARLSAVRGALDKKLKGLLFAAAEAAAKGVTDAELGARLEKTVLPTFDADAPFSEARAARQAAVVARRVVTQAVRDQVALLKEELNRLSAQVQADEKAVKRLSSLAKRVKGGDVVAADEVRVASTVTPTPAPKPPPSPKFPAFMDPRTERHSPRVKMQVVIDLHSDNNFFNGFSSNISDGGLFVATVNLLPIGTPIELSFSLPSGEKIQAHGDVRWVREINDQLPDAFPGLGIQFRSLDSPSLDAISTFVSSREPLFYVE